MRSSSDPGQNRVAGRIAWCSVPLVPLVCLLGMDSMGAGGVWQSPLALLRERPLSFGFEVLVVATVFAALLLLFRHAGAAAAVFGATSLIFGYVDFMKVALNGDPFLPQDLLLASNARSLVSFLSGAVPVWFPVLGIGLLLWVLVLFRLKIALPRRSLLLRWSLLALLLAAVFCVTGQEAWETALLNAFGLSLNEIQDAGACYRDNGFIGGFTLNVLGMRSWVPPGYSRGSVETVLAPYQAVAPDGEEPADVIVVLSESFSDVRELPGVTFSENPLKAYDAIRERENCHSGDLYVTAMSGGTVRTEFSMLTGLSMDFMGGMSTPWWYVHRPLSGYVSLYQASGYRTIALHPYDGTFYHRDQAFPWLGFESFFTQPDVEKMVETEYCNGYVTDRSLTRAALQLLEEEPERPVFLYIATMEAHQPYPPLPEAETAIRVDAPELSEEAHSLLTAYVQRLADADRMLRELTVWIDSRERPAVLVFFGDHRPNLGADHLTYCETGLYDSRDGFTPEEYQTVFRTPFLVYSNRDLAWDMLPQQTGNAISDYSLLTAVARATGGARSSWMELLADRFRQVPYWNARLQLDVRPESEELARALRLISYDRLLGQNWSGAEQN